MRRARLSAGAKDLTSEHRQTIRYMQGRGTMKQSLEGRSSKTRIVAMSLVAGTLVFANAAKTQDYKDLQAPKSPLVLKAQGSFFVDGKIIQTDGLVGHDIGGLNLPPSGKMAVNQMYVRYMIPTRRT